MQIEVLKSKIHRVKVTGADLDYIGSITIDEALLEAAGMIEGEKVSIVNVNNGERLDTYIIKGKRHSGAIVLNGPAARKVQRGHTPLWTLKRLKPLNLLLFSLMNKRISWNEKNA